MQDGQFTCKRCESKFDGTQCPNCGLGRGGFTQGPTRKDKKQKPSIWDFIEWDDHTDKELDDLINRVNQEKIKRGGQRRKDNPQPDEPHGPFHDLFKCPYCGEQLKLVNLGGVVGFKLACKSCGWGINNDARGENRGPSRPFSAGPTKADYEALGVKPGASIEEVKEAYRRAAKKVHPDKGGNGEEFIKITNAKNRILGGKK